MPDAPPPSGGTEMDPEAVAAIAQEFGELAEALVLAGQFAGASPLTAADFGDVQSARRIAGRFLDVVDSLAGSMGNVGALAQATQAALLSSAGLQVDTEATNTSALGRGTAGVGAGLVGEV